MFAELRDDMRSKAETHDFSVLRAELENNKRLHEQIPSREELVSRLENHARVIEDTLSDFKEETEKTLKSYKESQEFEIKDLN